VHEDRLQLALQEMQIPRNHSEPRYPIEWGAGGFGTV
jgi:hypothetical protein